MKKLFVLICVDVEPDRPEFGGKRYDYLGPQSWNGLSQAIPKFLQWRHNLQKNLGYETRLTWFFRADSQIEIIYGDAAFPLTAYDSVVDALLKEKDEVGWHVHTWRWNMKRGAWYQEIHGENWIVSCYKRGFLGLKRVGFSPTSFRAGWGFHNNVTIATLEELGIKVDLSAMPGIKNPGKENTSDGSLFNGFADWEKTPTYPYHPSKEDYQIPSNYHYELLEIPVTTFKKPLVSYLNQILPFRIFRGIKLAKPELTFSKYALSATCNPLLFKQGIQSVLKSLKQLEHGFLVTSFHADELLSKTLLDNLSNNIKKTISICEREKVDVKFLTATEAYNFLKSLHKNN